MGEFKCKNILPEKKLWEREWQYITQVLIDKRTDLIYDYPMKEINQCPTLEEVNRSWPNPCGYGTGTEDAMIYAGTFLDACLCRHELKQDKESEITAHRLVSGMLRCAFSAYTEGFLPRSVILQDGEGHYIDSSRDQYTMFVYGAYRYVHSDICESREREALARVLTGFARRAEQNVTKENAIMKITEVCGFSTDSIIAFGDDYADIGMLELCGTGVAMGNAIDEVKERADIVIGSNDEEGIADFIENEIL
mgnify:CR=1 FL=1